MFHNKEAIRQILRVLAGEAACVAQRGVPGSAAWRAGSGHGSRTELF